jgi:DivIVA domain-containing protein
VCAAVFVLVVAVAGSRGVFDGAMEQEEPDLPRVDRAPADAGAADLRAIRFTPVLWGYRPAEVDRAIGILTARLAELEGAAPRPATPGVAPGPDVASGPDTTAGPETASGPDTAPGPRTDS